jgi:hypothetical protein
MVDKIDELNRTITIDLEDFEELQRDSQFLKHLYMAGVDNWEGYDFALESMQEEDDAS